MDRSMQKNGVPIVRVGEEWYSNRTHRTQEVYVVTAVDGDGDVTLAPKAARWTGRMYVRPERRVRRSAFLGGTRGYTLVHDYRPVPESGIRVGSVEREHANV